MAEIHPINQLYAAGAPDFVTHDAETLLSQAIAHFEAGTGRSLSPMQVETYLLACYRYIELNPVRAGMVTDPGQYRWSSYRANGLGQPDARLTPHLLYLAQGRGADERVQAYRALFRPHLDAEAAVDIRQALQLGMPVGQDRFAELVCARAGVRFNSGKRGRPEGKAKDEMSPIAGQRDFGF